MKRIPLTLALLLPSVTAQAYLPPAFFVYSRIAEQKSKTPVTGVALTLAKPTAAGTEEVLGSLSLSGWKSTPGTWPGLSLIFESNPETLTSTITAFGLNVANESELLRIDREKLRAMKDPPLPFYRPDQTMSLKRARQTYAWVHSNPEAGRSIWIEKDTFLPLKIAAPCPTAATKLEWAKAGDNLCELEFRNLLALRRGNYQSTKMTLWKDGAPVLFFTFDRIASGKTRLPLNEEKLSAEVKEIAETILH